MTPRTAEPGAAPARFLFMVFHYPAPEHRDALAQSMREMAGYMTGQPGLVDVAPPWWDEQHQALVGISRWESEAAFRAAIQIPAAGAADSAIPEGERQPRQRFCLTLPADG